MGDKSKKIVAELYDFMNNLKNGVDGWVVHPSEFLPANVTVDFAGVAGFKRSL